MHHATPRRTARGLTLVEAMVVLAITAVLAGLGVPSFSRLAQQRAVEGAAAQLETDLQLARGEAVSRGVNVRLDVQAGAGASCYVVHDGGAGSCNCLGGGAAVCRPGVKPLRSVRFEAGGRVALASNSASLAFTPDIGTVTPTATFRLSARDGTELRQIVNLMGRVRSCSPTGLAGYKPC